MSELNAGTVAIVTEKLRRASENSTQLFNAGFEAGRVHADDLFWYSMQAGGERTNYDYVFRDTRWDKPFVPKYSFGNVIKATYTFALTKVGDNLYTDKLDFSKCNSMVSTFFSSDVIKLKKIDMRSCTADFNGAASTFAWCESLKEISEFYPPINTDFSNTFRGCSELETLNICSEITVNGMDLSDCKKLSRASIESIMNNLSINTSGLTIRLSKDAVNKAYERTEGANDGEMSESWIDWLNITGHWNIALV